MAWVRPKHPKRKEPVDPTESLRPILEYFSCSRPNAPNSNSRELVRIPKKPLLLHDTYESRPQKHHYEESEHHQRPDHHHQRPASQPSAEHHPGGDHHTVDDDRADYYERSSQRSSQRTSQRRSQRTTSHYTREISPPPPPPPLSSYRSTARPGAHLRLMPSRHHIAADTYTSRRPTSRWASATTPLDM